MNFDRQKLQDGRISVKEAGSLHQLESAVQEVHFFKILVFGGIRDVCP